MIETTDHITPGGAHWSVGLFSGAIFITTTPPDNSFKIVGWTLSPFQAWICVVAEINLGVWKPGFRIAYELRRV